MRRSIPTWLGKSGTRPDVIDWILNDAPRSVTQDHYNFAGIDSVVRKAIQKWPDHVTTIAVGKGNHVTKAAHQKEILLAGVQQAI